MKKLMLSLALVAFTGTMAVNANTLRGEKVATTKGDDKKADKKKSCDKKSSCCKKGEKSTCHKETSKKETVK